MLEIFAKQFLEREETKESMEEWKELDVAIKAMISGRDGEKFKRKLDLAILREIWGRTPAEQPRDSGLIVSVSYSDVVCIYPGADWI